MKTYNELVDLFEQANDALLMVDYGLLADQVSERTKLDQVPALPVGGHTPGDFFLGLRDAGADQVSERTLCGALMLHIYDLIRQDPSYKGY